MHRPGISPAGAPTCISSLGEVRDAALQIVLQMMADDCEIVFEEDEEYEYEHGESYHDDDQEALNSEIF